MLSILGFRRSRLQAEDVATSVRLRDGETDELLRAQHFRHDPRLELGRAEVEHRWQADDTARQ